MELISTYLGPIIIGMAVVINIFSFLVMAYDKRRATYGQNTERTPEGFIFFMAAFFASVGVYLGMLTFRHKTQKWYFQVGIPLLILQNLVTVYFFWEMVSIG